MWNEALVRNIPLLETYHSTINIQHYEKGNLEDHHSGHRINPHGSPDCPRNDLVYGTWPHHVLRKEITLSTTKELTASQVLSVFFFLPEMCHNLNILRNFAHANENDIEQTIVIKDR